MRRKRLFIPVNQFLGVQQKAFTPVYTATDGSTIYTYTPGGGDIKGAPAADVAIASGSLPTNGQLLSSLADAANTTPFTIALQPDIPRNIGVAFKNTNLGGSTGNATTINIIGTFRGAAQTDAITFSALELTSTAQNEVAMKYGTKPFDSITSITPTAAQPANWQHAAGPGCKIGLPVQPDTNAESDIIKLTKSAANLAITGTFSSTNQTVNFGAISDNDDISVIYAADYDGAAGAITAIAVDTLLVSAGAGNPVFKEIGTTGIMALVTASAGDDIRSSIDIPWDLDRHNPVRVRAKWASEAAAVGSRSITWKVLYGAIGAEADPVAAPATALSTPIAADVPLGTAKMVQWSPWGVISAGSIAKTKDTLNFLVEMDAFDGSFTEDKYLLGLQIEYTRRVVNTPRNQRTAAAIQEL